MSLTGAGVLGAYVEDQRRRRVRAGTFFEQQAERIARLCHRMAERFARGGRLLALGADPAARSDARHVAVEFVHPVIVGKRALPALAFTAEGGPVDVQLELVLGAQDIVIAFGAHASTKRALMLARERGALTVSCGGSASHEDEAEWSFRAPGADANIDQELVETLYHVLWELVHVFFEHRGLLDGRTEHHTHDTGASSFLYPFLGEQEHDLEAVIADVRASVLAKATEASTLRAQTLAEEAPTLVAAATGLRSRLEAGGRILALGNGGSATDAMDLVADLRTPAGARRRWPAIDLTEDTGVLTAIANDIGVEAIFSRQVIAHGRPGDALLAMSTSGGSANVIHALAEARRRDLMTIALVGYDGGRILEHALADHVVVVRSEHIPRIQEAHASAYHVLCQLLEMSGEAWA
ncbi:MAG TPA: SIS domain-containing protein [Solirubrobacteraceae bacterium]|jgi:D-sedoheptulose 7-phosphate isomerase|nr:SIS domain-containing protein [Solirubrobacteraceae bacterium]